MGNSFLCPSCKGQEEETVKEIDVEREVEGGQCRKGGFCCQGVAPPSKGRDEDEEEFLTLSSLNFTGDELDTLSEALSELHEAVELYRKGLCSEAADKLAHADKLIDMSPKSNVALRVRRASQSDPDLADLRQLMSSSLSTANFFQGDKIESESGSLTARDILSPKARDVRSPKGEDDMADEEEVEDEEKAQLRKTLQGLEDDLTKVRDLCRSACVFEAHDSLEALQRNIAAAQKLEHAAEDAGYHQVLADLTRKLHADPVIAKLRLLNTRMRKALEMLTSPRKDKGVKVEIADPKLGPKFKLFVHIRFAEGEERIKKGPATQLIISGDVRNFPAPLSRVIIENTETDLCKKEWIKDCTHITGKPGRPARLYTSLVHASIAPPMLPVKLEDAFLREFAVCPAGEWLPERGPGVLVVEHRAGEGAKEIEGTPIPPKGRGNIRLNNGMNVYYKTQAQDPNCSNFLAAATMGLPVPQAVLPLSLLKRVAADLFLESIRRLKVGCYDRWSEHPYDQRCDTVPELYSAVSSIGPDRLPGGVP